MKEGSSVPKMFPKHQPIVCHVALRLAFSASKLMSRFYVNNLEAKFFRKIKQGSTVCHFFFATSWLGHFTSLLALNRLEYNAKTY